MTTSLRRTSTHIGRASRSMQEPALWIFMREGLCNRLRTLISALGYAVESDQRIVMRWTTSTGAKVPALLRVASYKPFRARFDQLFDVSATPRLSLASRWDWHRMRLSSLSAESSFPPSVADPQAVVWLDRYQDFYGALQSEPLDYARQLRLSPDVLALVEQARARFGGRLPRIGVHARSIRAHELTAAVSTLDWFKRCIGELLSRHGESGPLFLSTDDVTWSRELHRAFPGQLIESMDPPAYNSVLGIRKGVVDLTLLAACNQIVGSYGSSFSEFAFELQGRRGYADAKSAALDSVGQIVERDDLDGDAWWPWMRPGSRG